MGIKGPVDKLLNFGALALSGTTSATATELPDTLSLNKAQTERMAVKVICTEAAAGGTSVAVTLKGSDDNSSFTAVGAAQSIVLANLTKGNTFVFPIPDGTNYKYYKVAVTPTGTFTAGKLDAYVDTYMGI